MKFELKYDYIAILLLTAIWTVKFFYRDFPSKMNRIYNYFLGVTWFSVFLDIAGSILTANCNSETLTVNYLVNVLYYLSLVMTAALYYNYTVSLTHEQQDYTLLQKLILHVPLIIEVIAVLSTPYTHLIFYFDQDYNYCHGKLIWLSYITELGYVIVFAPVELIRHARQLKNRQILAMAVYSVFTVSAALFQITHPEMLVMSLGIAISVFIFRLTLRNPLEFIDTNTGAYNHSALREFFYNPKTVREHTSIGIIKVSNIQAIAQQFGMEEMYSIMKGFLCRLKETTGLEDFFFMFQNSFVFMTKSKEETYLALSRILQKGGLLNDQKTLITTELLMLNDVHSLDEEGESKRIDVEHLTEILCWSVMNTKSLSGSERSIKAIDRSMIQDFERQDYISRRVNEAIRNEDFDIYLQPVFDLRAGRFTSAEVLIRLKDYDNTFISPEEFICECEKNGSILNIGDIVIKKTCRFIRDSSLRDYGIQKVKINLSTVQCMQNNIADHLLDLFKEYSIPYDMICFEITESFLVQNTDHLLGVMKTLISYGIEFALDDYGTGYSNTERLMNFPFGEIKFDRSLVNAALSSRKNESILSYLMGMVKASGLTVLAEGVETKEGADLVSKIGADCIQGNYFAPAMNLRDFEKLMKAKKERTYIYS